MKARRIVIFGCGYVGRRLAEAAVKAGNEVWIHSRNADSLAAVGAVPSERRIIGDLHDTGWHDALKGPFDIVYNLVSSAGGGLEGYRISYVDGNRSIRDWAKKKEVSRFIYSSATSVYPQTGGEWVDEEDVPEDARLSPSGRILRQSERELLGATVYESRIVARLAGIYGPGRHLYLDRLKEGATFIPGDGAAWLNLIYREDIVSALIRLAEADLPREADVFNVVDNTPSRKQEIADWLADTLGLPRIPFDPSRQMARTPRRMGPGGLPDRRVSNAKIREQTGWEPAFPDFRAGYRDILESL